jgi:hypothetical protein
MRVRAKVQGMERIEVGGGRISVEFKDPAKVPPRVFSILGRKNRECFLTRATFIWPYSGDPMLATERMMDSFEGALKEIEEARASLGV